MGQARQGIGLVHELRQLRRVEELFDGTHERTHVDERQRRNAVLILRTHAFANHTLHTRKTNAYLVLDEFTNWANTTVGEVVLVVEAITRLLLYEVQQIGDGGEHFAAGQHRL